MYQIVLAPQTILSTPAKAVDFSGEKLTKITQEMIATMLDQKDPEGVGLAANQVNLPWNIFVARFDTKKGTPIHTFINAKILERSKEQYPFEDDEHASLEGCLSIPQLYGVVRRSLWIKVEFERPNSQGELEKVVEKFAEFPAVVIQHEMDHLSGHLFVERILEQKGSLFRNTGKDKKGKDVWEEVRLV